MSATARGTASVLVICKAEDVAKRIESHLRNAGHAARTIWCTQADAYGDQLRREPPDVILCADDVAELPPATVLATRATLVPDVPVLLMAAATPSRTSLLTVMNAGAADGVGYGDEPHLKHLEQVFLRELAHRRLLRELRVARIALAEHSAREQRLLAGSADAVAQVQEGILTHVNKAFAQMLAHDGADALESQPLMDLLTPASQTQVKPVLKLFTQNKLTDGTELELEFEKADGKPLKTAATVSNAMVNGERAMEIHIRAAAGATVRATSLQTSGRLELFEAMADLPPKTPVSLLLIRIDEFQLIEERLGYRDAEEVMLQFAHLLRARTPKDDKVFRFSSAEFAWLAFGPAPTQLQALAETLRRDLTAQAFHVRSHEARLTVSLVAQPLRPGSKATDVIKNGLAELRQLLQQGTNKIKVTGLEAAPVITGDAAMAPRIKRALDENRFKLAYQSIASLEGDSRQHFDVRVRMIDEAGRELLPRDFLDTAQKFGLLARIDQWVIARALKVLARRDGAPEASTLFVRLSEDTLKTGDEFLTWFRAQLKLRPLRDGELGFSLSEDYLRHHAAKSKALTTALRALKAEIVLEQFGSTTQSAELLEQVQAHYARFDADFTQRFNDKNHVDRMTVLVQLAKQRGVKTICSHVEDANVMARLWQMGINYIQGQNLQEPEVVLLSTDARR